MFIQNRDRWPITNPPVPRTRFIVFGPHFERRCVRLTLRLGFQLLRPLARANGLVGQSHPPIHDPLSASRGSSAPQQIDLEFVSATRYLSSRAYVFADNFFLRLSQVRTDTFHFQSRWRFFSKFSFGFSWGFFLPQTCHVRYPHWPLLWALRVSWNNNWREHEVLETRITTSRFVFPVK